ncbi:MAG: cell division protein ZapA [Pseudomonadota bacterium]
MSKVTFRVGPKSYTVATAKGDEDRVASLGAIINEKYALLGTQRAVQEVDNLVFAALFLADELDETRKAVDAAKKEAEDARSNADTATRQASENAEHEKAKAGGKKAELRAEIDTLRKAEERAREENKQLKAQMAEMREAARHQHDLFGEDALAAKLEALADRAEQTAAAFEKSA